MTAAPHAVVSTLLRQVRELSGRQGLQAIAIQAGSYLPKAAGLFLVGRYLSAREIGTYGVLTALAAVLAIAMPFSAYFGRNRPGTHGRITPRDAVSALLDLLVIIVVVGVFAFSQGLVETLGHTSFPPGSYELALLLFGASGLTTAGRVWLQSDLRYVASAWLAAAPEVLWIVPFVVAALFVRPDLDLLLGSRVALMIAGAAIAVGVLPWARLLRTRPTIGDFRAVCGFSLPLALVTGSLTIVSVADRLVLTRYISLDQLGRYTFMYLLFSVGVAVSWAAVGVISTRASGLTNVGAWSEATVTLVQGGFAAGALPMIAGVGLWAAGPAITAIVGKELLPSDATILFTGVGLGLLGVRLVWQVWFQLHYRTGRLGLVEIVSTAVYLVLLILLGSAYGTLGAALAMVAANLLALAFYAVCGAGLIQHDPI